MDLQCRGPDSVHGRWGRELQPSAHHPYQGGANTVNLKTILSGICFETFTAAVSGQ